MPRRFASCLIVCLAFSTLEVHGAEFHVAPAGTAKGAGTKDDPWDLPTALAAVDRVKPGDTVWLHAGTYRGGFESRLAGKPGLPVVIRGAPGERATIDTNPRDDRDNGLFLAMGADAVYRDFELTCSHPQRETKIAGPWPADIRRGNFDVRADRVSCINLVVHDCGSGFGFWGQGEGGEVSGCLIYNNGWRGPDRGHGHAIYAQNEKGTKKLRDNILFHQFAYGIHVYGSSKASLKGFDIEGNIAFDNGCLTHIGHNAAGIMVGGESPAERISIRDNIVVGGPIRAGYTWGAVSEDLVCTGNYAEGLIIRDFRRGTVAKNVVVAHSCVAQIEGAGKLILDGFQWNENDYYVTDGRWGETAVIENNKSRGLTFDEWRTTTGFDKKSTLKKGHPSQLRVTVRPNAHEAGRAHIAVLNPESLPEVDVDLSAVLKSGAKYRIVSAKDFYGKPLITGTYEGKPVRLAMKPVKGPPPVGMSDPEIPATEPRFGAFVVLGE